MIFGFVLGVFVGDLCICLIVGSICCVIGSCVWWFMLLMLGSLDWSGCMVGVVVTGWCCSGYRVMGVWVWL